MTETKVVAFGGGHGLAATLRALRMLPIDITAIVTVADNLIPYLLAIFEWRSRRSVPMMNGAEAGPI
jgi:hypothetical protein